jgi:hypothetical protein
MSKRPVGILLLGELPPEKLAEVSRHVGDPVEATHAITALF